MIFLWTIATSSLHTINQYSTNALKFACSLSHLPCSRWIGVPGCDKDKRGRANELKKKFHDTHQLFRHYLFPIPFAIFFSFYLFANMNSTSLCVFHSLSSRRIFCAQYTSAMTADYTRINELSTCSWKQIHKIVVSFEANKQGSSNSNSSSSRALQCWWMPLFIGKKCFFSLFWIRFSRFPVCTSYVQYNT